MCTEAAAAASTPSARETTPFIAPLQQSVRRFHGWEPLRVEGDLPADLRGTLIRTGPGLYERFGHPLSHSFEADGALSGLRLAGDGQALGSVRVVESPGYREEEAAGKALFGSAAPRWRRLLNIARGRQKTTGNTSVMHWQGRTFALMEGARPVEIDHETLETADVVDFGGVLGQAFSAHPHRVESLRTTFNFGQVFGGKPALQLYAMPDDGPVRRLGTVGVPWNTMVHDFAISEKHAVFIVAPAKVRIAHALLAAKDLSKLFAWDESCAAELIVVPLDDVAAATRTQIDSRWVFHLTNAAERNGELVVDWVQYPDFGVFSALTGDGQRRTVAAPRVQRLVVDPKTARVRSEEVLLNEACEFPVLPAARFGHAYSASWYSIDDSDVGGGGVARFDAETGALDAWRPGPGHHASEPLFVPRPSASRDDDGWLVSLVYDGARQESYFGVFDADRPSAGPSAKLWMGQPIPVTFHGTFIPAGA